MPRIRVLSRRDAALILTGAISTLFFAAVALLASSSAVRTAVFLQKPTETVDNFQPQNNQAKSELLVPSVPPKFSDESRGNTTAFGNMDLSGLPSLPETTIVEHVPGWTLFRDIYMEDGTLLILTSSSSSLPKLRYITSTGLAAENTAENAALREPTPRDMDIVDPEEALQRWGRHPSARRVWSVESNTLLFNDPSQFLNHYYHFCAELLFGTWSLWTAAVYPEPPPPIHRAIFPHSSDLGWRDDPGFNGYFLRAAFPSLTVEVDLDWADRIDATSIESGIHRAWHFPYLLLADSESVDVMVARSKLDKNGCWWRLIRNAVWRFAGVAEFGEGNYALDDKPLAEFEETEKIVITYISRQSSRRCLIPEDHDALVKNLKALVQRKNTEIKDTVQTGLIAGKEWELNVVKAEKLTKDGQIRLAARTTILLGIHGNGLSHLILMPRTKVSAVIEIFYPGGFAHDYEWTTRALGLKYFGIWNDSYFTGNIPDVDYPEGFQGTDIPVHGLTIANIIEKWIGGEL